MISPIIPVHMLGFYELTNNDLITGFNAYGVSMTGALLASEDFGYYIVSGDRILFDVVYVST